VPSTHVSVRLSHDAWTRYAAQAEAHDLALGTYLRRRLEQQDEFIENELALRSRITKAAATGAAVQKCSVPIGLLVEMLFLLRQLSNPQRSAMVNSEVRRLGLETWEHPGR
jgi:hypothetical protein